MGAVVALAFVVYTLFHCILTPASKVRSLPKGVWIVAIIVLPVIGAALWYWLGMPSATPKTRRAPQRGMGPDDDAEFLRQLNIRRQQQQRAEDLAKREQELRRRESELKRKDPGTGSSHGDDATSGQDGAGH
jgi:multidrug resistance efflux pump